jgi:hypothetical protein
MTPPGNFNPIVWTSQAIRPFLPQISVAITSSVLAVFGSEINGWFKQLIRKKPFVLRVSAFVLLVAFGYGALNLFVSHYLSQILILCDDLWLSPLILVAFILIGILAEERRQI